MMKMNQFENMRIQGARGSGMLPRGVNITVIAEKKGLIHI